MTTNHRARPGNLALISQAPFASHHCYHSALPMEDMLDPAFYGSVRPNLQVGDTIRVVRTDDAATKVLAWAEIMVVERGPVTVDIVLMQKPVLLASPAKAAEPAAPEPKVNKAKAA